MKPNKYLDDVLGGGELRSSEDETISETADSSVSSNTIINKSKKKDSGCFNCGCLTISFLAALYFGGKYLVDRYIENIYEDGNVSVYREPDKKQIYEESKSIYVIDKDGNRTPLKIVDVDKIEIESEIPKNEPPPSEPEK